MLNETITNYESVKVFSGEVAEQKRYDGILKKLQKQGERVQETLTELNVGQDIILNAGMTLNLIYAALKVSQGAITPGDFILIQALAGQLAGPMHLVGTVLREAD